MFLITQDVYYTTVEDKILNLPECNKKVEILFFRSDRSHVCVSEDGIREYVSKFGDRESSTYRPISFTWFFKEGLVDLDYIKKKISELQFDNITHVSLHKSKVTFTQEFESLSSDMLLYFFEDFTSFYPHDDYNPIDGKMLYAPYLVDPRVAYSTSPIRDDGVFVSFHCTDTNQVIDDKNILKKVYVGDFRTKVLYVNKATLTYTPLPDDLNNNSFEFGSLFPTRFESDTLKIYNVSEMQCTPIDPIFAAVYSTHYIYTLDILRN